MSHSSRFAFVSVSGRAGPDADNRLLIRSHAMRGRNRRDDSRRSIRARTQRDRSDRDVVTLTPAASCHQQQAHGTKSTNEAASRTTRLDPIHGIAEKPGSDRRHASAAHDPPLQRMLFSDLDTAHIHGDYCRELIHKYCHIKTYLYPIEHCVNFGSHEPECLESLLDGGDAIFQCLLLTASAIQDFAVGNHLTAKTCFHLDRTIRHLNENLSRPETHATESVSYVILTLCMLAGIFGDTDAMAAHLGALGQIVSLRRGMQVLRANPRIQFKISRLELSWCLESGKGPLFTKEPVSWEPFYTGDDVAGTISLPLGVLEVLGQSDDDQKLMMIFRDLDCLTRDINHHQKRGDPLDALQFQDVVGSVQARLLGLRGLVTHPTAECLRLGMLAFLSTTFRLPRRKGSYRYLVELLRIRCQEMECSTLAQHEIGLWLLMVGMMSVLEPTETWLRARWSLFVGRDASWEHVKRRLQKVMWIESIHDEPGRQAFQMLSKDVAR